MADNRRLRIRFSIGIMSAIVAVVVATSVSILSIVHAESMEAAEAAAGRMFAEIAERIDGRVEELMGRADSMARTAAAAPGITAPIFGDGLDHPAVAFMTRLVQSAPSINSVYVGHADGRFLQVASVNGDPRIIAAMQAPEGTWLAVRSVSVNVYGQRLQTRNFFAQDGRYLGRALTPNPDYDPRKRRWYELAIGSEQPVLTDPYVFSTMRQPGLTAAQALPDRVGVFGVDLSLQNLTDFISGLDISPHGEIFVYDEAGRLLASSRPSDAQFLLAPVASVPSAPLKALLAAQAPLRTAQSLADGESGRVIGYRSQWQGPGERRLNIAVLAPMDDFTGHIARMRDRTTMLALVLLGLLLPVLMLVARRVSQTVVLLSQDADRVRQLNFAGSAPVDSFISEFFSLSQAFGLMKSTLKEKTTDLELSQAKLEKLVSLGIAMAAERDSARLAEMTLLGAKDLANAEGGTLYIRTESDTLRFEILRNDVLGVAMGGTSGEVPRLPPVPMILPDGTANHRNVVSHAVHEQCTINIADAYDSSQFDFSGTRAFDERNNYRSTSFLTVPLKPRGGDVIGALQLINARNLVTGAIEPFSPELQSFVEALAAQASTALYNRNLLDAQEKLMDSMIKIIAGAIDAKSPYTGGHCERVPELALMLAQAATDVTEGSLAEFAFTTEEEWREFKIGAWLHDCGKVTTPEYVVDKATKLETIHNRIHEIRTRFEVLLRDARIEQLEQIAAGADPAQTAADFDARQAQLIDDFAFVAECNLGGEFMAKDKVERLQRIAQTVWQRHFDDRLGLSHEELKRYDGTEPAPLPAREPLLADKPHHIVAREQDDKAYDPAFGFRITVPEHRFNFGELYNLSIGRGTLTEEERYKINEHIVQTIVMLETLPFPKHLKRVPEYAGTHHETMIGSGYPRKLDKDGLSVPSRIMAIADIFEALTASDRPYKKAKTLSESIKILSFFRKDQHIDSDLFELFLTSGVYRAYAERYLRPEQIDAVDISQYLTQQAAE